MPAAQPAPRFATHVCSYALLPYLYTLFLHANATGAPVMRPLWWEFPADDSVAAEQQLFMLGALRGLRGAAAAAACACCSALPLRLLQLNRPSHTRASPPHPPIHAGPSLLVAPVLDKEASAVQVLLPGGGLWYDGRDGRAIDAALPANQNFRHAGACWCCCGAVLGAGRTPAGGGIGGGRRAPGSPQPPPALPLPPLQRAC